MNKFKNINFLVGELPLRKESLKPYDNQICKFLSQLSLELNNSKDSNVFPDIKTLSFFCRSKNINRLKNNFYKNNEKLRTSLGLIFHITPSNIPINFAYSLIFGLLTGNSNIVKVPSKNYIQIKIICDKIRKVLRNFNKIKNMINIVKYQDNDNFTKLISTKCDARIIWGGDETIKKIRNFEISPRTIELTFADRYSLCIINSDKLIDLKPHESQLLAERFYNDTFTVDQNACSSPHLILWLGKNSNKNVKDKFWNYLSQIVDKKFDLTEDMAITKYTKLFKEVSMDNIKSFKKYKNNIYTIQIKNLNKNIDSLRGNYGYFYEMNSKNLNILKKIVNKKIQTITYFGFEKNIFENFLMKNSLNGIDRIVPIGQALDINFVWDGHDLNRSLTRIIDIK